MNSILRKQNPQSICILSANLAFASDALQQLCMLNFLRMIGKMYEHNRQKEELLK